MDGSLSCIRALLKYLKAMGLHTRDTANDTQTLGRGSAVTACPAHSAAADGLEPCALHMGVIKRIKSA